MRDKNQRPCDNCGAFGKPLVLELGNGRWVERVNVCAPCLERAAAGPLPVLSHQLHDLFLRMTDAPPLRVARARMPQGSRFSPMTPCAVCGAAAGSAACQGQHP